MTGPVELETLWLSRRGREVLRVTRCWWSPASAEDPGEWAARGHPVRGGKPLVCSVSYLTANYRRVTP